jgi:formylglycine-generating enzyme required for sulfatase activity
MHAETLAYLLHWIPFGSKRSAGSGRPLGVRRADPGERVSIPAGTATLGLSPEAGTFGWDNEFRATRVEVPRFRIDKYDVTNGQFLEFMRAGGYEDRSLWSPGDWTWKSREAIGHPRFWERGDGDWMLRSMFDLRPLPLSWPVYVSHAEASAYAAWTGARLPTEAEFHRAAYGAPDGSERPFPWG